MDGELCVKRTVMETVRPMGKSSATQIVPGLVVAPLREPPT